MARGETIAGLDIGTTKTCAVIAASGPDGLEIIGVGEAPSTGMRKGGVTDLEATVHAIEAATEKAERMAGVHVSHVYAGVTGEHTPPTARSSTRCRATTRSTARTASPIRSA